MLIQYTIFWKLDPKFSFKKTDLSLHQSVMDNANIRDMEVVEEGEYIVVKIEFKVQQGPVTSVADGWVDVGTDEISRAMMAAENLITEQITKLRIYGNSLKLLGNYHMLVTGTEKGYWKKSGIDVRKLKFDTNSTDRTMSLRDIETDSNLTVFDKDLFSSRQVYGDNLQNLKLPTTIFGFGTNPILEFIHLPHTFLLNIDLEASALTGNPGEIQESQFRVTVNKVIYIFGKLLVYIAKLIDLHKTEYFKNSNQATEIRTMALKLQMKINGLIIKKSEYSGTVQNPVKPSNSEINEIVSYQNFEEKLLFEASRYFSLLTELNHVLASANYQCQKALTMVERMTLELGLVPMTLPTETNKETSSLSLEFKQFSASINTNFQNLTVELEHTQSTIRNTVDILKTFLESEQRVVSQKSSEAINWIVIVFAGLGLADALGNFVIFWLQGGSAYQAISWFFIIMIVLFTVIITLYFWYFRTPKYLRAPKG